MPKLFNKLLIRGIIVSLAVLCWMPASVFASGLSSPVTHVYIPPQDYAKWGVRATVDATAQESDPVQIPAEWFNSGMKERGSDFRNIWLWRPNRGGAINSRWGTSEFCANPGQTSNPGAGVNPAIVTEMVLYEYAPRGILGLGQDNNSLARILMYMRTLMVYSQDAPSTLHRALKIDGEGSPKYFERTYWKYSAANVGTGGRMLLPIITSDNIPQPWSQKLITVDGKRYYGFWYDLSSLPQHTGNGTWPNGPLQSSVSGTSVEGVPGALIPRAFEYYRMREFRGGPEPLVITSLDPRAAAFDVNPNKSQLAIFFECEVAAGLFPGATMELEMEYDFNPLALGGTVSNPSLYHVVVYDSVGSSTSQPTATIAKLTPMFTIKLTIPINFEPPMCTEDCPEGGHVYTQSQSDCAQSGGSFIFTPYPDSTTDPVDGECDCKYPEEEESTPSTPCGASYDISSESPIPVRWYNLPLAFAETKMGSGYNEEGTTTSGTFDLNRDTEVYEVMQGVPETERLYVNGGGTEGFMDVEYEHMRGTVTFAVKWTEVGTCAGCITECDEDGCWTEDDPDHIWSEEYCKSFTHAFSYLHLKAASYRTPTKMRITNPDLYADGTFEIPISAPVNHSYSLTPNANGLEHGPGVGSSNFNIGAESSWSLSVTVGPYDHICESVGPHDEARAISDGNAIIGNIFAQNDELRITIGGTEYLYVENNKQSTQPLGNSTAIEAAVNPAFFFPVEDAWHSQEKVPLFGYIGQPEAAEARNVPGSTGNLKPFVKENLKIVDRKKNGIIPFEAYESQNLLIYDNAVQIKERTDDLHPDTSLYAICASEEITNPAHYLEGTDSVKVQYTDWQYVKGTHYDQEPDGTKDAPLGDKPHYYSVNPVIIHNPVTAQYAWISDIQDNILQDQRILKGVDPDRRNDYIITQHSRALSDLAPARLYIDFDFRLVIPNTGTMSTYWEDDQSDAHNGPWTSEGKPRITQTDTADNPDTKANEGRDKNSRSGMGMGGIKASDFASSGIIDPDEVSPGTKGKGYKGASLTYQPNRSYDNPYDNIVARSGPIALDDHSMWGTTASANDSNPLFNTSKWINAKYVRLPFDVFYYGNTGNTEINQEPQRQSYGSFGGGAPSGFYAAGEWIKLYDNGRSDSAIIDPTVFYFHVASHESDQRDVYVDIVVESINAPDSVRNNPQALWDSQSEWYANGKRAENSDAMHSAINQLKVDIIGRIGNAIISDSSDPAWTGAFWNVREDGTSPYTEYQAIKYYAMYHNMFEQTGNPCEKYNRYGTLFWFSGNGSGEGGRNLPVLLNPLPAKNKQVQKLGYDNTASVQTLGDHDGKLLVYPEYIPAGNFQTGSWPANDFRMYATDPFNPNGQMREFYSSKWAYPIHNGNLVSVEDSSWNVGKFYLSTNVDANPTRYFQYYLGHTLIDTRAKISHITNPSGFATERDTPSYVAAQAAGSNKTYLTGQPAWIEVTRDLRTWMGSPQTTGRLGVGHISCEAEVTSFDSEAVWKNAQRWNFKFGLPKSTMIIFDKGDNFAKGRFEGRTSGQYIYTEFVYRTWGGNTNSPEDDGYDDWDLSTWTNTGAGDNSDTYTPAYPDDSQTTYVPKLPSNPNPGYPDGSNPEFYPEDSPYNPPNVPYVPPTYTPNPNPHVRPGGGGTWYRPPTPQVIVDYSNPSDTDKTTIGTH